MSLCPSCFNRRVDAQGLPCAYCHGMGSLSCCEGAAGIADELGCGGWPAQSGVDLKPDAITLGCGGWPAQSGVDLKPDAIAQACPGACRGPAAGCDIPPHE